MIATLVPMARRVALLLARDMELWLLDPPGEDPTLWVGTRDEVTAAVADSIDEPWPGIWEAHLRRVQVQP